jgi:hypothetical protein
MKIFIMITFVSICNVFHAYSDNTENAEKSHQEKLEEKISAFSVWLQGKNGTIIIPISPATSKVIFDLEKKENIGEFSGYSRTTEEGHKYRATLATPDVLGFVVPSSILPTERKIAGQVIFWINHHGQPLDKHFRDVYSDEFKDAFKRLFPLIFVPSGQE